MNKPELSVRIATETSLSTASTHDAVTAVLSAIDDALASGETEQDRRLRNLLDEIAAAAPLPEPTRTGESIATDASKAPSVKVGKTLGQAVH